MCDKSLLYHVTYIIHASSLFIAFLQWQEEWIERQVRPVKWCVYFVDLYTNLFVFGRYSIVGSAREAIRVGWTAMKVKRCKSTRAMPQFLRNDGRLLPMMLLSIMAEFLRP